ncbi:hypothetical protein Taro_017642 [Colocasia esculenta]|uniref:Uncharacterized protein n=1 Tax=Colocasia esculenta TaxID=4460 RepID=A0A843URV7_COLES|nr:hypothetical protein [Colocasia esculenta]
MVTSLVGCPMFSISQAISSGLCPGTCAVPSSALLVGGTDTSCRHWSLTSPFPVPHSSEPKPGSLEVSGMGLRPCGPQPVVMADRRNWGGGGDDPEESTQRMIERIWESLTDIWMRMDQQAPVPPVTGEAVPVAPVQPPLGVERALSWVYGHQLSMLVPD